MTHPTKLNEREIAELINAMKAKDAEISRLRNELDEMTLTKLQREHDIARLRAASPVVRLTDHFPNTGNMVAAATKDTP
jgi:uncharacterized protein with von Willebrand factor type A (vWA) domain